jgi:short-subunit dehydrogenase
MKRTALVTGASSGIGDAFAEVLAAHGYDLVVTARRADRLEDLAARLAARYNVRVTTIPADLSEPDACERLCDEITRRDIDVDMLVNNAGYGLPGAYDSHAWERHQRFLRVLVLAVTELSHRLLPGMLERGHGRIINVASLAGLLPAPAGHTLYAASKAFLVRFSEALAHEVRGRGVHVTALCPGFTSSEFHDVTGTRKTVSRLPAFMWMRAADVAREGYEAVEAGVPALVTGRVNRTIALAGRLLPQRLVGAFMRVTSKSYRST